ncbi:MAG: DUF86 domain-containing protein [Gammaproteobacteria bacterium]
MPLEDRDAAYLWDMLQAAKEVEGMMEDYDLAGFLNNRMLQRAVERSIEIIGEAARRVSSNGQQATSEIPWREIIGQRNILAHEYGQIDHELLYKTVVDDIPELIRYLGKALPPIEGE